MRPGDLVQVNAFGLYNFSRDIGIIVSDVDGYGYYGILVAKMNKVFRFLPCNLKVISETR
jgi:hypothetical protein